MHSKGAYFARGSGHNPRGHYTEDPVEYQQVLDRLTRKWSSAAELVPKPVLRSAGRASRLGIVAFGSSDSAVLEAVERLADRGLELDYLRVRAFPFGAEVQTFLDAHERIFVVEQNRDAQLKGLLSMETALDKDKLVSVLHYSGIPIDSGTVVDAVTEHQKQSAAA